MQNKRLKGGPKSKQLPKKSYKIVKSLLMRSDLFV